MIREYHAVDTFHEDPVNGDPIQWNVFEGGLITPNVYVDVIEEKNKHKKVVEFYDNDPWGGQHAEMSQWFGNRSEGIIEWWMSGNQLLSGSGIFEIELFDTRMTSGIYLAADWSQGIEQLDSISSAGGSINNIIPSPFFTLDTWHHIMIDFDCNSSTFDIWVNLNYIGQFSFNNPVQNLSFIMFRTIDPTSNDFYGYVDAIDYSWEDGYYINRNLDYTTLHNFRVFDPYPPEQVSGLTATNLGIGNTLNVSWTLNAENDIEYYNLYMSNTSTGPYILKTTINHPNSSYIVSNLIDGNTYYFKVSAVDGVPQKGENSTIKAGIPSDTTPPAKVENLSSMDPY
jgi:hypothetical protein